MTSNPPFGLDATRTGDTVVLTLTGELDLQCETPWISEVTRQCATHPTRIVADMAAVTFIDSSGLRLLINGKKIAAASGVAIGLTNVPPTVSKLFTMTGLLSEFDIEPGE